MPALQKQVNIAGHPVLLLTDEQHTVLKTQGMPNCLDDVFLKNMKLDKEPESKGVHCLLPLVIADQNRSDFAEFVLKITTANKKMCWDYKIDLHANTPGKVIENDYNGSDISLTVGYFPSEVVPVVLY